MKKEILTVRDVDEETLGMFKAKAAEHKMKLGKALTEAMQNWLQSKKHPKKAMSCLQSRLTGGKIPTN